MPKNIQAYFVGFLCLLVMPLGLAKPMNYQPLDKVMLQLGASQWVRTSTATVSVAINATLDKAGLARARQAIMVNLKKIADGDWHVTQFNRSQDNSGLERLNVRAQARLPEAQLVGLRDHAKAVSQPGSRYTIANIDFSPSQADIMAVKKQVRQQIYQQVQQELQQINRDFSKQHYSVMRINFLPFSVQQRRPQAKRSMEMFAMAQAPAISVSNKVTLTAIVVLASNRQAKDS